VLINPCSDHRVSDVGLFNICQFGKCFRSIRVCINDAFSRFSGLYIYSEEHNLQTGYAVMVLDLCFC
jgi:hypothetical protein